MENTRPKIKEKQIFKVLINNPQYMDTAFHEWRAFFVLVHFRLRVYDRTDYILSRTLTVFSGVKEFRAASKKPPGKTQMMKKNIVQAW